MPAVEIIRNQSRSGRTLKRIGDIVFSLLVLTLGSPIFILIGILVKLSSPGSVFYIQKRVGDVVFSSLVLTIGSPIFILIGILVKLSSPGSIFYIQKRVGRLSLIHI